MTAPRTEPPAGAPPPPRDLACVAATATEVASASDPTRDHAAGNPQPRAQPSAASQHLYRRDWSDFTAWCAAHGHTALPATPAAVAAFLAARPLRGGTLARRAAAIADQHRRAGFFPAPTADPTVTALLRAGRRAAASGATRRQRQAQLARLAASCPRDLAGLRDRALLLLARAAPGRAGLTASAVLALTVEQLRFIPDGLAVRLADTADDDGTGAGTPGPARTLTIAAGGPRPGLCPVQSLRDWLRASATLFGPVFRKIDRWGNVEHQPLAADALRRIIARRTRRPGGTPRRGGPKQCPRQPGGAA